MEHSPLDLGRAPDGARRRCPGLAGREGNGAGAGFPGPRGPVEAKAGASARGRAAGRRFAAAVAVAAGLAALPAGAIEPAPPGLAGDGCDPGVAAAMEMAAVEGIRRDAAIIRNPVGGIADPGSLFDFTCLDRLLGGGSLDIHFSVGGLISGIMGAIQGRICEAARRIFAGGIGRRIEIGLLRSGLPRLPGLDVGYGRGGGGGVRIAPPGHGACGRTRGEDGAWRTCCGSGCAEARVGFGPGRGRRGHADRE